MKTYNYLLPIGEDTANYLQRLHYEVQSYNAIVDHIFTSHANDVDDSVISSVPFKTYIKQAAEAQMAYDIAKNELSKELEVVVKNKEGKEEVYFNWNISDFASCMVEITLLDNPTICGSCNS